MSTFPSFTVVCVLLAIGVVVAKAADGRLYRHRSERRLYPANRTRRRPF